MKLYNELAGWWHLLSAPEDYEEEARLYLEIIRKYKTDVQDALEMGSGGGNNAFHLKKHFDLVLTDVSPAMIAISKKLNPECRHEIGDMRTLNLNRQFDLVFIHDAIMYIKYVDDLEKVFRVAHRHLKVGGLLLIVPDFFEETFQPSTSHGGHDDATRGIRYLEWTHDANPDDAMVETILTYIMKNEDGQVTVAHDVAQEGLFSKRTWADLLAKTGFQVNFEPVNHSEAIPGMHFAIAAIKH